MARSTPKKNQSKAAKQKAERAAEKGISVELVNEQLTSAFGSPFMLANLHLDQDLIRDIAAGNVELLSPDDETEPDDERIAADDPRLQRLLHADLCLAIEHFLRTRDPAGTKNIIVTSQADSDHVWDIGQALQDVKGGKLSLAKGDHRWLLQKVKDFAFQAFPMDARMFIDALDVEPPKNDPPAE